MSAVPDVRPYTVPPPSPSENGCAPGPMTTDPMPGEPFTDVGYAHRFVSVYGDRARYVFAWKRWLIWDGKRWAADITGQVERWMKTIARRVTTAAKAIADKDQRKAALRLARRQEQCGGIRGALAMAASEAGIAVRPDQLDAYPFLLNCQNGTVDLGTEALTPHDPALLLTKITSAAYHPNATSAEFDQFLEAIQPDRAMRQYLARLLGHALQGRVEEHILPIFHGEGANGKSTLVETVNAALGDYCDAADPTLLTARTYDAHPTGVADLFGLRLAVLHETDQNRQLGEGTVKRLTGGDRLKARRMREDFWSFDPSHTFFMLSNHKPVVSGSDEGIWRRLRLVPFEVVIPLEETDPTLGDRLKLQGDALLAWLVNGHRDWRANGLKEPDTVLRATAAYKADSDTVGRFLEEQCRTGARYSVGSSELFQAWSAWCQTEGEQAGTNKALTNALKSRGHNTKHTKTGAVWQGVGMAGDDR